jgi:type I restriction enzyme S subunit
MTATPHVALAEIATPVQRVITIDPNAEYRTIGVKWWGEGAYERQTILGSQTAATQLFLVREGDLIINKIWVRHGSVSIAGPEVDGCAASNEFPMFELDASRVERGWLHWFLKTRRFWGACAELSQGTSGKNRIRPQQFLTLKVPLPSLEEQRKVVAYIEAVASRLRRILSARSENLSDLDVALISRFAQIIRGSPRVPFAEVAPLVRRAVGVEPEQVYGELGIRSFGKGTFHKPPVSGVELGDKRVFEIFPGDLLFNVVFAWEGAVAVARDSDSGRVGSHRFLTCVAKDGVARAKFLAFYFLTTEGIEVLGRASPGGAGRNRTLGLRALENILVPVPRYEEQVEFERLLAYKEKLFEEAELQLKDLDLLIPSVLNKAFCREG